MPMIIPAVTAAVLPRRVSFAENMDTTGKKKRGRSLNWLACETVGAFLARQCASRETGASSRREVRQKSAACAYPAIIGALDRAGLCAWSLESGKLPPSADESVRVRTETTAQATIYARGDALKQSLKSYCQEFGTLYPDFSKNNYAPSSGDNDGKVTWDATEVACENHFKTSTAPLLGGIVACKLAFRIVCPSSPYLPPKESDLLTYVDIAFALNPADRLDQETVPTQAELRQYKKKQLKIAANDMVYGQIPNVDATERAASDRQELIGFVREIREMMRAETERDENDHERVLRDKIRAEMQDEMRAELRDELRALMREQMLALKRPLEAEPSPQPPVSTHMQTPQRDNSPDAPAPAVAVEPSRRSVRVKRAKQRS